MMEFDGMKINELTRRIRRRSLRPFFKILAGFANGISWPRVEEAEEAARLYNPIFIIGAPRTGSTALYQAMTNYFNVAYIDNLAAELYENLPLGVWLSRKVFNDKPHHNFKAEFGNTHGYGWHAPSECGQFWYRWLSSEDHFVDKTNCSHAAVQEIRNEIYKAQSMAGSSLLFKNLNAGQRLRLISEAFPSAKIIYLKRDPRFTAASIINARRKNNVAAGQWWSVKPRNYRDLLGLDETEMTMAQVFYIERQIEQDLALFDPSNVRVLQYNDLSQGLIESLGKWLVLSRKKNGAVPEFFQDKTDKLSSTQLMRLTQLTKNYPFSQDVFI